MKVLPANLVSFRRDLRGSKGGGDFGNATAALDGRDFPPSRVLPKNIVKAPRITIMPFSPKYSGPTLSPPLAKYGQFACLSLKRDSRNKKNLTALAVGTERGDSMQVAIARGYDDTLRLRKFRSP